MQFECLQMPSKTYDYTTLNPFNKNDSNDFEI